MHKIKPKIIIVLGPTSSGKSDAAIKLAKKFDGEVISADSRQIYKGMNLGTGKIQRDPTSHQPVCRQGRSSVISHQKYISEGVLHYLIDVAEPEEDFNISHFKTFAQKAIEEILAKGKVPIICGGTGFWIDAITNDTQIPEVAPNEKLRNELEKKSVEELFAQLEKLDSERAKNIDSKNKVRLVRAIEICKAIGKVPTLKTTNQKLQTSPYDFLQIGIRTEREQLNVKIKKRLDARFNEGMIAEVEGLLKQGISPEWLEKIGLEYRWISRFLQEKISMEEMSEKLYFDIIHYAKRQMTWFKRNKEIVWLKDYCEIEKEVEKFLR